MKFNAEISIGNVIQIATIVIGMVVAWGLLSQEVHVNAIDIENLAKADERLEQRFEQSTAKLEDSLRETNQNVVQLNRTLNELRIEIVKMRSEPRGGGK